MRKQSALLALALMAVVPASLIACGDDTDDQPPGTGGTSGGSTGKGGSAGKGSGGSAGKGSAGSTGKGGTGGSSGGTEAGAAGEAGNGTGATGGTNNQGGAAGEGGEGNSPSEGGSGGEPPTNPTCDLSGEGKDHEALPNPISADFTATSDKVWEINGSVIIEAGATLTIEKCTRLEGSPAPTPGVLYATRGARLVANGEKDEPILFTSGQAVGARAPGQWGGVVLLGRAPITRPAGATEALYEGLTGAEYTYGGNVEDDDSGSLRYVRIEFGGYEILPDKEINGLSFAGVGSGTTVDHIMVSNTLDDCFEWWGGSVRADYLICNNAGDDNFDGDDGWQGGGEYWFGRRAEWALDSVDPNGFELDSQNDGTLPRTNISVNKVTLCGSGTVSGAPAPQFGMVLREKFTGAFSNLDLLGFEYGIDTRDTFVAGDVTIADSKFWELVNAGAISSPDATDNDAGFDDASVFTGGENNSEPDPAPYSVADCLNEGNAPADVVLESDSGAFADGSDWIDGLWVDWSEE